MTLPRNIKEEIVKRVLTVATPTRIILFGSFARGDADEDSDIDLLVVVKEAASPRELAAEIREAIGYIGYGVDVLVATEEMMTEYGDIPGVVYEEAQTGGIPLYVG
jgi:predicted nucleotidyltransferase